MGFWDAVERFDWNFEAHSLVETMKLVLDIDHSNGEMTDEEIKAVCREIGSLADDTTYDRNRKPIFGHQGIEWMIAITLYVFPKYWERMGLAEYN
ncbi:MAG: hypothetical protein WBL37_09035 [Dehalococcoidales bacterium]